jgi:biotin carboxyl carrier protein
MMNSQSPSRPGSGWLASALLIALVVCQACDGGRNNSQGIVVVNAPAGGEIRSVFAREGMNVVEGQTIGEIAISPTAQSTPAVGPDEKQTQPPINIEGIQAEIEVTRREVVRYQVEVQRLTPLVSSGQATQAELYAAVALYERAQQRLERLKTAAQQAQSRLLAERQQTPNPSIVTPSPVEQIAVVRAAATGTVSALNMKTGERVVVGQPLATIRTQQR